MRSMPIPRRGHQTASLLKLNNARGSEGHAVIAAHVTGQTTLFKKALKDSKSVVFFGGRERLAGQQISAGMIGDGQGVAVAMISQQELALVIGAPELIGTLA